MDPSERIEIASLAELPLAAAALLQRLGGGGGVVAFWGPMGAGKTTLIREVARQLGVTDNVTSPTFALVNRYRIPAASGGAGGGYVNHFDFYRITRIEEAFDLGYEEYFYSGELCLVEWPERIEALLPDDTIIVRIEVTGPESRTIEIR